MFIFSESKACKRKNSSIVLHHLYPINSEELFRTTIYIYKKAVQKLFILSFVTLNPPVSFGLAGFRACYEISSEV